MSWKDKAVVVDTSSGGSWKDRATIVDTSTSAKEAYIRGNIQGLPGIGTYADEIEGGVRSIFGDDYKTERNRVRAEYKKAQEDQPAAYISGVMTPTLATAPFKAIPVLGTVASGVLGTIEGAGASEEDSLSGIAKDALLSGGLSAATSGIGNKLANVSSKGFTSLSKLFRGKAEKLAENATGATAKQAEKFAEGAGGELLDRGFVRAGDSPENISKRLTKELEKSGSEINNVLKALDEKGVTANVDNVVDELNKKIVELSKNSSKGAEVKKIQSIIDDIIATGESKIPISLAEETKRGFRKQSGNWLDPEQGAAAKKAYLGYRDEAERAAKEASPELADIFKKEKETYGLVAPIEEAASRRAEQLKQQPWAGLLDTAGFGVGGAILGDDPYSGAAIGAVGRRLVGPRLSSTSAVTLNKVSKILKKNPDALGKFAPVLIRAQQRGGGALKEAHSILDMISPEYSEMVQEVKDKKK